MAFRGLYREGLITIICWSLLNAIAVRGPSISRSLIGKGLSDYHFISVIFLEEERSLSRDCKILALAALFASAS